MNLENIADMISVETRSLSMHLESSLDYIIIASTQTYRLLCLLIFYFIRALEVIKISVLEEQMEL